MLKPGERFERYTVEAAIGQGGMGAVYRAHDARLGRRVALKLLTGAGADAGARLLREARAAAALDHPNAVAIFDVGEHEGAPYIAMELVAGRTLRAVIGDPAAPPPATRIEWLTDVARVLAVAHRRGLVHRDIKPENVMVRDDGVVKVLDFGIARRAAEGGADPHASTRTAALPTLTTDGVKPGTPVYMAPEQIRGEPLDGRADQFAWGVLAYELLVGRPPWRGADDVLAVLASVLTDPVDPAPLREAPARVRAVILRALSKRPEDRFASMDELCAALEAEGDAPADPPPHATLEQRFATQDVREVLAQAVERQAARRGDTRIGFEELLAIAAEVGVDEASLREASRALRQRKEPHGPEERLPVRQGAPPAVDEAAEREAWIRRRRRGFQRHLGVYLIVNFALSTLLLLVGAPFFVPLVVPLMWGIGLGIHGLVALTSNEDDWADQKRHMELWRERQQRWHELRMARVSGRGAESGGRAGARRRVASASEPSARMRVGEVEAEALYGAEHEAEEEAAFAEEAEREKKRRRGGRRGR